MLHRDQHHFGGPVLPDASPKVPTGRHDLHTGEQFLPCLDQCLLLLNDWSGWALVWPPRRQRKCSGGFLGDKDNEKVESTEFPGKLAGGLNERESSTKDKQAPVWEG